MSTKIGCIHGRFQPFHNGHMEYFRAAYSLSDRTIIGITQYDLNIVDSNSPPHRAALSDNPFSYWERGEIIRDALRYDGYDLSRIVITPFPIHQPDHIRNFVDKSCTMYTTIYDEWNKEKVKRLRDAGFSTVVLWERTVKLFEGKVIRAALREGRRDVTTMIPTGALKTIMTFLDAKSAE